MKLLVLLNQSAGTLAGMEPEAARRQIAAGFAAAGAEAEVRLVDAKFIEKHARDALFSDFDAIIAGGGDGTLNTIANAIANGRKIFGVLPLGTHNHFARDLNVPLDLNEAVAALGRGKVIDLPVAQVNGRVFLNFSALGFHPAMVDARDAEQKRTGRSKSVAMLLAIVRVFSRLPIHSVRLSSRGHEFARRTPSIIVCNNRYQMKAFGVEAASVPERGLLNVYIATKPRVYSVIWLMFRALVSQVHTARHFDAMALPEVKVDAPHRRHLRVSIDGEVTELSVPLRYKMLERPMRVLVPQGEPENK